MSDKWKIIHSAKEIVNPGIFQEKILVIAGDGIEAKKLRQMAADKGAEFGDVPEQIIKQYPQAFAFWANKHDPKCSDKDLRAGNIRMKIN